MNAAAVALATFTAFPATSAGAAVVHHTMLVGRADMHVLPDLRIPDFVQDADRVAWIALAGCELTLPETSLVPPWEPEMGSGGPAPIVRWNGHRERSGRWIAYEQIPRRAGRPKSYLEYRFPLAGAPVISGYDLDEPNAAQRRGEMRAVGHGGVDLVAKMGTPIAMPRLEHQVGDADVLYVGPLYGNTVVTRHVVREGGVDHDYLLIFGHLKRAATDVRRGRRLPEEAILGFVGNTASPEIVHLHLEVRRVRSGVDPWTLSGDALHARKYSVVTDPRNVLPLRAPLSTSGQCELRPRGPAYRYWLGDEMTLTLE
jgi:murein DD-endopeptidase MepM/ murein hydrolase activator NlpD